MIQFIDEMERGHGRMVSVTASFIDGDDPTGLANTVLTAVVLAAAPPTVPKIGRSFGFPRQTIQRQANALVDRGLIAWVDNPDHMNSRCLIATDAGRAIHEKASAKSRLWAERFVADLDHDRLADAVATLRLIRTKLEAEARRAPD